MTAFNYTDDKTVEELMALAPDTAQKAWCDVGTLERRLSSGPDRALSPESRFERRFVTTKPYIQKGKVVIPAQQKIVVRRLPPNVRTVDIENPYSCTRWTLQGFAGVSSTPTSGAPNYNWLGDMKSINFESLADPWDSNDQLALYGKLRESIAGSSFNAGVALAESGKALSMISMSCTRIYQALRSVRRGQFEHAAKLLTGRTKHAIPRKRSAQNDLTTREVITSRWLELQYGWGPLVKDVFDAAQFLDERLSKDPKPQIYVVTRNAGGRGWYRDSLAFPTWAKLPVICKSSTRIVAKLTNVDNGRLAGLADPASVAWELLPYSFVADWVIPVGSFLSARGLASSITGQFIITHRFVSVTTRSKVTGIPTNHRLSPYHDGSKINGRYTKLTRTVSTSLSIPTPEVKPLGKVASWMHAANAVALLSNIRR